jgi:nucleoside-diphosphate-sugar epimerase
MWRVTRVMVLGGGGFIGAHLVRALLDAGDEVSVVDAWCDYGEPATRKRARTLAWRREHLLGGAEIRTCHTDERSQMAALMREFEPEVIAHLANLPLAARAQSDPQVAQQGIVGATEAMLATLHEGHRPRRLIYVSSSMVYGDFAAEPMAEDQRVMPAEIYGRLKLDGERAVRAAAERDGYEATVVRPSAVYGPGDLGGRFIERLVDAARCGGTLTLAVAPSTRLDFTFVGDLANGLRLACNHRRAAHGTFNLTRGEGRTLGEAISIVRALGHEINVVFGEHDEVRRPRRGALDTSRAQRILGYEAPHSLERGLMRYLQTPVFALA